MRDSNCAVIRAGAGAGGAFSAGCRGRTFASGIRQMSVSVAGCTVTCADLRWAPRPMGVVGLRPLCSFRERVTCGVAKLLCYSAWHAAACGVYVQDAARGLRWYQRVLVLAPLRRSVTLRWFQRGLVLAPLRRSFMYSGVVPLPPHRPPRCACVLGAAAPLANIIRCCNIPGTEAGSGASVLLATDSCHSCVGT